MSNFEVITRETIVDTLHDLTKTQETTIESCIKTLTAIKDSKKISESNLHSLSNVWRELDSLRELFIIRLLNSLKRGNIINS